jgi:hypothetical protein
LAENVPVGTGAAPVAGKASGGSQHRGTGGAHFHRIVHARSAAHGGPHAARQPHAATGADGASRPGADAALRHAMTIEQVPESWHAGLQFIMMQESGGRVDVRNPASSARGLFQLTASNYHLNPHGVHSFGNAVEEAQGGIRYVEERYGTVDNAVAHWRARRSY